MHITRVTNVFLFQMRAKLSLITALQLASPLSLRRFNSVEGNQKLSGILNSVKLSKGKVGKFFRLTNVDPKFVFVWLVLINIASAFIAHALVVKLCADEENFNAVGTTAPAGLN